MICYLKPRHDPEINPNLIIDSMQPGDFIFSSVERKNIFTMTFAIYWVYQEHILSFVISQIITQFHLKSSKSCGLMIMIIVQIISSLTRGVVWCNGIVAGHENDFPDYIEHSNTHIKKGTTCIWWCNTFTLINTPRVVLTTVASFHGAKLLRCMLVAPLLVVLITNFPSRSSWYSTLPSNSQVVSRNKIRVLNFFLLLRTHQKVSYQ